MDKQVLAFVREAGAMSGELPEGAFREAVEQFTADVDMLYLERPSTWFEADRNKEHVAAIEATFKAYGEAETPTEDAPPKETAPVLEALAVMRKEIAALQESDAPDDAPEPPATPEQVVEDDAVEDEPEGEGEEA